MDTRIININSGGYPERLKNIFDPPKTLFVKTKLSEKEFQKLVDGKNIGIVGTRKMTNYGEQITAKLTQELVNASWVITSGLALGIDGVAHRTAIRNGGKTVAVLGAGVDLIYPPEHRNLYWEILESGGAIVSEIEGKKRVAKEIFAARNRIISGLSLGVLVTEGARKSGSLITARMALDQGREVFAVPGAINSEMAEGTNYLLQNGAKLVTKVEDITDELAR